MKVFLGGTCNGSKWRDQLIPLLDGVDYFNPVVDVWDDEAARRELCERAFDDYILYVITPLAEGAYSIAEVVDDSNKRPEKTIMCILFEDAGVRYSGHQEKAIRKVGEMVAGNGGRVFADLQQVAAFLNAAALGVGPGDEPCAYQT